MTSRTPFLAGLLLASAVALAACNAPADPTTSPPGGSVVLRHDGDLGAYLIPAPADATDVNGGPITLAQDASGSGEPQNRTKTLQAYGFQAEVDRGWTGSDGSQVNIVLIRFDSSENATLYMTNVEEVSIAEFKKWRVPGLPDATVFEDTGNSDAGTIAMEGNAVEGDTAILVFDTEIGTAAPDPVVAYTKAQYLALTRGPISPPSASVPYAAS